MTFRNIPSLRAKRSNPGMRRIPFFEELPEILHIGAINRPF